MDGVLRFQGSAPAVGWLFFKEERRRQPVVLSQTLGVLLKQSGWRGLALAWDGTNRSERVYVYDCREGGSEGEETVSRNAARPGGLELWIADFWGFRGVSCG